MDRRSRDQEWAAKLTLMRRQKQELMAHLARQKQMQQWRWFAARLARQEQLQQQGVQQGAEQVQPTAIMDRAGVIGQRLDDMLLSALMQFNCGAASLEAFSRWQLLSVVCRHFHQIVQQEPACWNKLVFTSSHLPAEQSNGEWLPDDKEAMAARVSDEVLCRLVAAHGPMIRQVHLGNAPITGIAVSAMAANCPELHIANLAGCKHVESSSAQQLVQHCPLLEELHVTSCVSETSSEPDLLVQAISTFSKRLKCLTVSGVRSESVLTQLLLCCPLTSLELDNCNHLGNSPQLRAALAARPLRCLKIEHWNSLTNLQGLEILSSLDVLSLGCDQLNDNSQVEGLLHAAAPSLTQLSLGGCVGLSADGWRLCFDSSSVEFSRLTQLDLSCCNLDDAACEGIASRCAQLTCLNLSYCFQISHVGVTLILEALPIQQLRLRGSIGLDGHFLLEAYRFGFCNTFETPPNLKCLRSVDMSLIGLVNDRFLEPLLTQSPPSLEAFSCGGEQCEITDLSISRLPTTLTALDLTECGDLRNFVDIARLHKLRLLTLDDTRISSTHLICIVQACPITMLSLANCRGVDDDALNAISASLTDLTKIELRNSSVSTHAVRLASKSLPSCDFVWQAC